MFTDHSGVARTLRTLCALTVMTVIALLATPATLHAQRQPVVMAHGIRSDASTWSTTAPVLEQAFPVQVLRRTTVWQESQTAQADSLRSSIFVGLPDSTIGVGHSNGGIVLRQAARDGAPMRALLTVGTLHSGAPAAQNVMTGSMAALMAPVFYDIENFALNFSLNGIDFEDFFLAQLVTVSTYGVAATISNVLLGAVGFSSSATVWQTMFPSSPYILSLNDQASLSAEAQDLSRRGSVRTSIGYADDALYRLALTESGARDAAGSVDYLAFLLLEGGYTLQYKYCGYENFDAGRCYASYFVVNLSYDIAGAPGRYCARIFNENVSQYDLTPGYCLDGDAVVPYPNQQWPNASSEYEVLEVSHTEQTANAAVRSRIEGFLEFAAGVARCGYGPLFALSVNQPSGGIVIGHTAAFSVTQADRCGVQLVSAPAISISSSDMNIASAWVSGLTLYVYGAGFGTATITVQSGGLQTSINVVVQGA